MLEIVSFILLLNLYVLKIKQAEIKLRGLNNVIFKLKILKFQKCYF